MMLLLTYIIPLLIGASQTIAPKDNINLITIGLITTLELNYLPISFAGGLRYVPKWKKQACEIPAAQHPTSHYVCDEAGEVKCLPGWTGDLCDVPICRKGCDPLQGYCRRPGECRCKLGFYGELCDKCVTLPGCQHGRCNVSFECACDPGWQGFFCSEPVCDSECHPSQGYCEKPGECRCRMGWQGPKCKQCSILPGCLHGTCQGPLECNCKPGWTGFLCQIPICSQGCSRETGGCRKPGTCRCRVGWTGPNCTHCVPYPGCVHGSCRRPWECRCEPGWTGELCNEKLTFCDDHPTICQNNGTCVSRTVEEGDYRCICPMGYAGRQCQIEAIPPATDLTPPMPQGPTQMLNENNNEHSSQENRPPIPVVNSHQGHLVDNEEHIKDDESNNTTIDSLTLGPILITDPITTTTTSTTIDSAATAGKWPTESLVDNPVTDSDLDNEA